MTAPFSHPDVWRAQSLATVQGTPMPTGFASLDEALGGGWPSPSLIELLVDVYGIGEIQLIRPLIKALVDAAVSPALIVWINPPHQPNAVALAQHGLMAAQHWTLMDLSAADALWCMEKAIKSGACTAVIAWAASAKIASLRRLKLAIAQSKAVAILYRPGHECSQASPATVRVRLAPDASRLRLSLIKVQGRIPCELTVDIECHQLQAAHA
jgi:hypothetical protein